MPLIPEKLLQTTSFDYNFWLSVLQALSYPIEEEELDIATLRDARSIPSELPATKVSMVYKDDYVEAAIITLPDGSKLSRSLCTRAARFWKNSRLHRPLLMFTNAKESYAVMIPGKGTGGEAKVLGLSDKLYRTDREVLESMRYPGSPDSLSKAYDNVFFPYERVRNEFFEGYRALYSKVERAVRHKLGSDSASYAQRFLGRLMFLYFLQRKGWLKNDRRFLDKIRDYGELNKLFYESLNRGANGIPFLNGSLFDKEAYMTPSLEKRLFSEMDAIFKDARNFFNSYNFTVDEASPLEVEVSIDPALIGTVFENMLPEYERGSKGTFYTPPSETSFICRRALAKYLGCEDQLSEDQRTFKDGLQLYIEKLSELKSERAVREFREKIFATTVLDPAVGSGGFLLVMMQEMVRLIQEAESTVGWRSDAEEYKKRILPKLYGFDIESEAVEIARLRLWLSLIVDQKEPEPLPNLDMNLLTTRDSLVMPDPQVTLDPSIERLRSRFNEITEKYLNEHNAARKKALWEERESVSKELEEKTGIPHDVIEASMPHPPDIVVMNPPYVRQEAIGDGKKAYYASKYGLDRKSDLYAYFMVRALRLVGERGVVSLISSDKWLETDYGVTVQSKLKPHLLAVYGQRERTFGADINTVITVLAKSNLPTEVHFICLASYARDEIRQLIKFDRGRLKAGKWFYMRLGAKFFIEKLLPKLTRRLSDFADIRRGFTTGANEFFYMKDVSHLYEADRLTDPKKFQKWHVTAKTRNELEQQGLIYIENEGGERFVIDRKDLAPIVRSPRQLGRYLIPKPTTLCLYTQTPGPFTRSYIRHGESKGLQRRPTLRARRPWYALSELKPARILLPMSLQETLYIAISNRPLICDHRLYVAGTRDPETLWTYLASTVFLMTMELYCRRLGGGGGASDIMVEDYKGMPVPDLNLLNTHTETSGLLKRAAMPYYEEVKQKDRIALDKAVLETIGLQDIEVEQLYSAFLEAVDDRLIKADRPLQRKLETTDQTSEQNRQASEL